MPAPPLVTIAVPSFQQGRFLDECLASIFEQKIELEVFVLDGGSTDGSPAIIQKWAPRLAGWRSAPDKGQAAAINEGIRLGTAPYVAWLNSDDWYLPGGLELLIRALEACPLAPAAYGGAWNALDNGERSPVWVEPFNVARLARRCIVSQPACLIRRTAWEAVGGVDEDLRMVLDYDLWWRLYRKFGPLKYVADDVAVNRDHPDTKTNRGKLLHFLEARRILRTHLGHVPWNWWASELWYRLR
jgi:glycosyltransferase involved in cell wall biosynthesis